VVRWGEPGHERLTIGAARGGREFVELWHGYDRAKKKKAHYEAQLFDWARRPAPRDDAVIFECLSVRPEETGERTEADLIREIATRPEDEEPRRVLADLWMERGDARGTLIQLTAEWERCTYSGEWHELVARIKDLYAKWLTTWAGPAARFVEPSCMNGGFIERVNMSPRDIVDHASEVFAAHPIRHLRVMRSDPTGQHFRRMMTVPELARVRTLEIERAKSVSSSSRVNVGALGTCRFLSDLESLRFAGVGHSADDWKDAFGNVEAPKLSHLSFRSGQETSSAYDVLSERRAPFELRSLEHHCWHPLDGFAVARFVARSQRLKSVHLARSGWTDATASAWFEQAIERIALVDTGTTPDLVDRLVESRCAQSLKAIRICNVGPPGAMKLLDRAIFPRLDSLEIFSAYPYGWAPEADEDFARAIMRLSADHPLRAVTPGAPQGWSEEEQAAFKARFRSIGRRESPPWH
jgi:uncharacterized protein (TIGR02996 family)